MHVRSTALDRIEQDLVHEADDGRVFDVVLVDVIGGFLLSGDIEILEIEIVVSQVGHGRVDGLDRLGNPLLELVLLDDHRVDPQAGLELDVIDRLEVGRIGDAEEKPLAAFDER